jgi:transposase
MAVADGNGLPIACGIASGERAECRLVVDTINQRFVAPLPERLIGDMAYDSNGLDAELAKRGVEMIAPHNPTVRRKTQDGRPLRRYRRRWHIERLFAWLMRSRRLVTRYEHNAEIFLGFLKLACARLLWRRLRNAF